MTNVHGPSRKLRIVERGRERRPWWRSWLPEPFWSTLLALLGLSVFTAVPLYLVFALIWPNATSSWPSIACYLAAIPVTWWLVARRP